MWSSALALFLVDQVKGSLTDEYCLGYSQTYGEEKSQVTDDAAKAFGMLDLINSNPDFEFTSGFSSDFNFKTDKHSKAVFVDSVRMQVQIANWADFIVSLAQKGDK